MTNRITRENLRQQLRNLIYEADEISPVSQAQSEKLVEIYNSPSLPTNLIIETLCNPGYYSQERASLNFPSIKYKTFLSASQQIALEMAFSNSPITLISGTAATGKTAIAKNLVQAAIECSHKILILAHNLAALNPYYNLVTYPFLLSQQENYSQRMVNQLRDHIQHSLARTRMDYLPLYLLPDGELAKLRTPAILETLLPKIPGKTNEQIMELLRSEFTEFAHLAEPRLQLLAHRLQQLLPFLQEQLRLMQIYNNLSEVEIQELANRLLENPQVTIVGTVSEFMQLENKPLWDSDFDLIIVEEANLLNWRELIFLSGLCQKLVLFGEDIPRRYFSCYSHMQQHQENHNSRRNSFFRHFFNCFQWLQKNLSPAYVYKLQEQFRLHPKIAETVYPAICDHWVYTHYPNIDSNLSQIAKGVTWKNMSERLTVSQSVGEKIYELVKNLTQTLSSEIISEIGIITFSETQRDNLKEVLTANHPQFRPIFIGTAKEWSGAERRIIIVNCMTACSGGPNNIALEDMNIALTRAKDQLFLVGDHVLWRESRSPIRSLLYQSSLSIETQVVI
ncbi:MAG: hypothetical protein IV298_05690 [Cylindrospermopsis raciborskii KL1]|uniref:AAA domain-containing protein n=1 Tax=Cylindrospermopsis raciborskii TaxID=77022 RepID=UPI001A311A3C|nr:AAA domain-containing protein [Cylindrospermopsis raciborskii]MBG0742971.1 hypothetical protein [Cylindrospermopsis raciborskii KL1]